MFEGGGEGGSVTCHCAWGQLFALEELSGELCYQAARGSASHPPHQAQKILHHPSKTDLVDGARGAVILHLEKLASLTDLLTASRHGAAVCPGPGGICLTVVA